VASPARSPMGDGEVGRRLGPVLLVAVSAIALPPVGAVDEVEGPASHGHRHHRAPRPGTRRTARVLNVCSRRVGGWATGNRRPGPGTVLTFLLVGTAREYRGTVRAARPLSSCSPPCPGRGRPAISASAGRRRSGRRPSPGPRKRSQTYEDDEGRCPHITRFPLDRLGHSTCEAVWLRSAPGPANPQRDRTSAGGPHRHPVRRSATPYSPSAGAVAVRSGETANGCSW
jgi:hypothetical protein